MAICCGAQFSVAVIQIYVKNEAACSWSLQVDGWLGAERCCEMRIALDRFHVSTKSDITNRRMCDLNDTVKYKIRITFNSNTDLD